MSPAQSAALRRAAASTEPTAIPAATARVLAEQYRYVVAEGDGWVLTPLGRAHLAGERASERHREAESKLTVEDRRWGDRVKAWLEAHQRFNPKAFHAYRYAHHIAACDHAGIEPVATNKWADGDREFVEIEARAAAECLRDYDKEEAVARDRGVSITIEYGADDKVPRSRSEAIKAASGSANIVRLSTFRERRPGPGAA